MFLPPRPTADSLLIIEELSDSDRQTYLKNCVHSLIVLGQKKTPIKRVDLNKIVFPGRHHHTLATAITQAANKELIKNFGMRLFELEDRSKYLLVNINYKAGSFLKHSDSSCEQQTILFFVLMDIIQSLNEKRYQTELEKTLSPFNDLTEATIKDYLDSFVKNLYLNQEFEVTEEGRVRVLSWGPRAVAEIDPDNFFKCFLEFNPNTQEKEWPQITKRIDKLKAISNRYEL